MKNPDLSPDARALGALLLEVREAIESEGGQVVLALEEVLQELRGLTAEVRALSLAVRHLSAASKLKQ